MHQQHQSMMLNNSHHGGGFDNEFRDFEREKDFLHHQSQASQRGDITLKVKDQNNAHPAVDNKKKLKPPTTGQKIGPSLNKRFLNATSSKPGGTSRGPVPTSKS